MAFQVVMCHAKSQETSVKQSQHISLTHSLVLSGKHTDDIKRILSLFMPVKKNPRKYI